MGGEREEINRATVRPWFDTADSDPTGIAISAWG